MRYSQVEKATALRRLQHLKLTSVYSLVRTTSRTTHTKIVDFVVVFEGRIVCISNYVAVIIDATRNARGQLVLTDSDGGDVVAQAMGTLSGYCTPTLGSIEHREL